MFLMGLKVFLAKHDDDTFHDFLSLMAATTMKTDDDNDSQTHTNTPQNDRTETGCGCMCVRVCFDVLCVFSPYFLGFS